MRPSSEYAQIAESHIWHLDDDTAETTEPESRALALALINAVLSLAEAQNETAAQLRKMREDQGFF